MNYKNAEGYADPTAYKALTAVAKIEKAKKVYKPLVYVASPYAGEVETNVNRARGYCRFVVAQNCIPIAPHLHYPQFLDDDDKEQRELGLFFALVLLGKCDEIWVFGNRVSNGMAREIEKAEKRSIPIKRFNSRCEEVSSV
jgi:hypothetical protein